MIFLPRSATFRAVSRILAVQPRASLVAGVALVSILGEPETLFMLSRDGRKWRISGFKDDCSGSFVVPTEEEEDPFLLANGLAKARFRRRYEAAIALAEALDCTMVSDDRAGYAVI